MKIAIQGESYSFHAIATRHMFGEAIELIHYETFQQVFDSINNRVADCGVVAIENSLYGSINDVYDLLLKYDFWISAETYEQINLNLLGTKQASLETINEVYSQAPALSEASKFLDKYLPKASRNEHFDTSAAAKLVHQANSKTKAAIASSQAAKAYSLNIISRNIETDPNNFTRFIAIQQSRPKQATDTAKTSITFSTADKPGALFHVLKVFYDNKVNLSKLESRPIIGQAWSYMYYLDFEEGLNDDTLRILNKLDDHTNNLRVLGSYKKSKNL